MRKLLLATAAVVGGSLALAGTAQAQWAPNVLTTTPAGQAAVSGPGFGTAVPSFGAPLAPSTMTVHIGGRVEAIFGTSSDNMRVTSGPNGGKTAGWGLFEYTRIYPSLDAVAANGLQYGVGVEIRQDNGKPATSGPSGAAPTRGALYLRREFVYFGTPNLGYLRIGSTDQPTSLFLTGNFENYDTGQWDGDISPLGNANAEPSWPFEDVGNLYTTNKFVYLSPQFFKLIDFGVSFAPTSANLSGDGNDCSVAGSGCSYLSSTNSDLTQAARPRNIVDAVVRLRTSMGPWGVAATVGYDHSGRVNYAGGGEPYKDQSFLDGGLQITYGGLAFGGHATYGDYNPFYSGLPVKGARKSMAWLLGASYAFGPAVVGASYFQFQNAGAWNQANSGTVARTREETGLGVGGTLNIAPGAIVYLSYLYGHRHQVGYNFETGTTNTLTGNNTRSQIVAIGTQVRW